MDLDEYEEGTEYKFDNVSQMKFDTSIRDKG